MWKKALWMLACLSLTAGCQRISEGGRPMVTGFEFETVNVEDGIPRSFGQLVGITPIEGRALQVVMWFEDENQQIKGVAVNVAQGAVSDRVLVVPRR